MPKRTTNKAPVSPLDQAMFDHRRTSASARFHLRRVYGRDGDMHSRMARVWQRESAMFYRLWQALRHAG